MNLPRVFGDTPDSDPRTEAWLRANGTLVTLALLGVNLLLKLPRIGEQGLWYDEAVSLSQVQGAYDLGKSLSTDASAPLYGALLYGWTRAFGPSLEAARVLSALLSSATAGCLFAFGRRFLDARTGLFAALLFTLSRTQLYFGHEARAYALVGLLCIGSFWGFLALVEAPTRRRIFGNAVLSAALVYAHYVALFALCAQLLAALSLLHLRSRAMHAYVASQLLAAALFAPCAIYLLLAGGSLPMAGWIRPPVPGDALYVLSAFTGGPLMVGIYAAVLAAAFASAWLGSASFDRSPLVVLGLWAFAPLVLDYAFSFAVPSFLYRYLLYGSLGLFLLTAYALVRFPVPEPGRWILLVGMLVPAAWGMYSDPILRSDWRGAAQFALEERADGVLTVVTPAYQLLPFAYHYAPDAFADPPHMVEKLRERGVYGLNDLDGLGRATAGHGTRVVVLSATDLVAADVFAPMAAADYEAVRAADLVGIQARVFDERETP